MTIVEKIAQIEPIRHPAIAASPAPSSPRPIGNERLVPDEAVPNHGWIRWAQTKLDRLNPED